MAKHPSQQLWSCQDVATSTQLDVMTPSCLMVLNVRVVVIPRITVVLYPVRDGVPICF